MLASLFLVLAVESLGCARQGMRLGRMHTQFIHIPPNIRVNNFKDACI